MRVVVDRWFEKLADEFIARVRVANIGPASEVVRVFHCVDQAGNPVQLVRASLEPTNTVKLPDDQGFARQFAALMHLDANMGNINSQALHFFLVRGGRR